jgi:hypothetical protein
MRRVSGIVGGRNRRCRRRFVRRFRYSEAERK